MALPLLNTLVGQRVLRQQTSFKGVVYSNSGEHPATINYINRTPISHTTSAYPITSYHPLILIIEMKQ